MDETPVQEMTDEERSRKRKGVFLGVAGGVALCALIGSAIGMVISDNSKKRVSAPSITVAKSSKSASGGSTTQPTVLGNTVVPNGPGAITVTVITEPNQSPDSTAEITRDPGSESTAATAAAGTAGTQAATTSAKTTTAPVTSATTIPKRSATTATTLAPTTLAPTTAAPTTTMAKTSKDRALALAQQYASALANLDAGVVTGINPARTNLSGYRLLTSSTVIPASVSLVSGSTYNAKLGLVALERSGSVDTTKLYCVVWAIDSAAGKLTEKSGRLVRSVPGASAATTFTAELQKACA
jgi:hypothetical protein